MRVLLPFVIAALLLTGTTTPAPSSAKDKNEERRAKQEAQQAALAALQRGEILPLTRIMAIATAIVPGDIIEIEYEAGPLYEVEVLTPSGQIRELKLDARTGKLLRIKEK